MEKAIIVGAGTYGQVYSEYLKNEYEIVGFVDDNNELWGASINNIPVLGSFDFLASQKRDISVFVPIGNNTVRVLLLEKLIELGFNTPSFIHKQTIIHTSVKLGKAVYILPGTNIMPCTELNDFVMVSMGVNIAHHNIIGKGCFFSQGTNIGASITIEEKAYFGIGSTLMTGVKNVGKNSLIGAGAVIIKDIPKNAIVAGVPAKILRYKK
ncbi:acetyltransferase [Bacteroidales bacterium OttesenSCG-928-C19]|nr:acetyltransferase [Bacteroidales bacterium OttesenSCG-928-C19]